MSFKLNVSAVKAWQECQQKWWNGFQLGKAPAVEPLPLTAGKLWHKFMEERRTGIELSVATANLHRAGKEAADGLYLQDKPNLAAKLESTIDLMIEAAPFWTDRFPGETLAVEEPIELLIGHMTDGEEVILIGIPDEVRLIGNGSKLVHRQTRTLSDSTDLDAYLQDAERDLHELLYGPLIMSKYRTMMNDRGITYAGTEMDIFLKARMFSDRKCKSAGTKWHQEKSRPTCDDCGYAENDRVVTQIRQPHELFVQELIPVDGMEVNRALRDVIAIAEDMKGRVMNPDKVTQTRAACRGKFGRTLCAFHPVCIGDDRLDSENYIDRESRYDTEDQHE